MKGKSKTFLYRVHLEWKEARKGVLSSFGKPDIEVATPAEFRGHEGVWTPEDLFVAGLHFYIMRIRKSLFLQVIPALPKVL